MFVKKVFYHVIDINIKCHDVNNDNRSLADLVNYHSHNHNGNIPIVVQFYNFDTDLHTYNNFGNSACNNCSGVSLSRIG